MDNPFEELCDELLIYLSNKIDDISLFKLMKCDKRFHGIFVSELMKRKKQQEKEYIEKSGIHGICSLIISGGLSLRFYSKEECITISYYSSLISSSNDITKTLILCCRALELTTIKYILDQNEIFYCLDFDNYNTVNLIDIFLKCPIDIFERLCYVYIHYYNIKPSDHDKDISMLMVELNIRNSIIDLFEGKKDNYGLYNNIDKIKIILKLFPYNIYNDIYSLIFKMINDYYIHYNKEFRKCMMDKIYFLFSLPGFLLSYNVSMRNPDSVNDFTVDMIDVHIIQTLLIMAVEKGLIEILELFYDWNNVICDFRNIRRILSCNAISKSHFEIVKFLYSLKDEDNNFIFDVSENNYEMVCIAVEKYNSYSNCSDSIIRKNVKNICDLLIYTYRGCPSSHNVYSILLNSNNIRLRCEKENIKYEDIESSLLSLKTPEESNKYVGENYIDVLFYWYKNRRYT